MRYTAVLNTAAIALALSSVSAEAQSIVCGTYGNETRSTGSYACPGGSQNQSCSETSLYAPYLTCAGSATGGSCAWTSEVAPVGGCTTCVAGANQCGPRICAPSVCGSGSYLEVCDGFDNDGGGQVDEGCPSFDRVADGLTTVSFVHAPTGQFVPPVRSDVHYAGTALPVVFERVYTSLDYWPYEIGSRLGTGWFHTYDERVYDAATFGPPDSSATEIIHRRGARGRRFVCSSGTCVTNDGSLDTLSWISSGSYWRMQGGDGTRTEFFGTGADWQKGALWRRQTTRGVGWTVAYYTSGAL